MTDKIEIKVNTHEYTFGERDYLFDILFNGAEIEGLYGEARGSSDKGNWEIELTYQNDDSGKLEFDYSKGYDIKGTFKEVRKFIEKNWNIISEWLNKTIKEHQEINLKNQKILSGELKVEINQMKNPCPCPDCKHPTVLRTWITPEGRKEEMYCQNCDSVGGVCE